MTIQGISGNKQGNAKLLPGLEEYCRVEGGIWKVAAESAVQINSSSRTNNLKVKV